MNTTLTEWQRGASYIGASWEGWIVGPCSTNRDAGTLERSNWECAKERIMAHSQEVEVDGEMQDGVQVVSENHWACGWVEWLAIHPSCVEAVREAEAIAERLEDYPVLNEDLWRELEYGEYEEAWKAYGHFEFIRRLEQEFLIEEGACDDCTQDQTMAAFESLIPSGEYHNDGAPNIQYAIERAKRDGLNSEACNLLNLES